MIIYQFITPAFHISFSYSLSRAALVHSGSCGYRDGGFSARKAGQDVLVACLCRFVQMNNNYFLLKAYTFSFLGGVREAQEGFFLIQHVAKTLGSCQEF